MGYLLVANADGRHRPAQVVLAALKDLLGDGIRESWDENWEDYLAQPYVHFWDDTTTRGYIVSLNVLGSATQINLGFFQHNKSDDIVVVRCDTPKNDNIRSTDFPDADSPLYNMRTFAFPDVYGAAQYILTTLTEYWCQSQVKEHPPTRRKKSGRSHS